MAKQLSYILLGSMFFGVTTQEVHADDWGKNLLLAGGIGAGIVGAISACNWLFSESDEQLVIRAVDTYRDIYNRYGQILDVHQMVYQRGYDEDGLYRLACVVWDTGKSQSNYRSSLSTSKNMLRSLKDTLRKRINKLTYANEYDTRILVSRMRESLHYIEQLLPRIESLSSYLYAHRHYFDLFDADGRIRNVYQDLIDETAGYRYDEYQVTALIKRYAVRISGGRYPLTTFAGALQKDIDTLKSALRRADSRYYNRISCGQQLVDTLSHVLSVLCSDSAYAQEYHNREYERREQERFELQRQQARFERERLKNERRRLEVERERLSREQWRERHTCNDQTAADVQVSFNVNL